MKHAALFVLGASSLICLVAGCNDASKSSSSAPVAAATPQQQAMLLDQVKKLAGTWESADEKGNWGPGTMYAVSSGGSTMREVMFPGTPHEMTNIYTMDGASLVMTHYCAMGNQPHLRCTSAKTGELPFTCDGVSNMHSATEQYMGRMTLVIIDNNNIEQRWTTVNAAKGEPADFTIKFRRKA